MDIKNKKTRRNLMALMIAAALAAANILLIFIFQVQRFSFEYQQVSVLQFILSLCAFLLHIILCIFLRIKKYTAAASGLFVYQLIGAVSYFIYFIAFMLRSGVAFFETLFRWWSFLYQPFVIVLSRITGISLKFSIGLCYLLLTYISGRTILSIRKDIAFERNVAEDKEMVSKLHPPA